MAINSLAAAPGTLAGIKIVYVDNDPHYSKSYRDHLVRVGAELKHYRSVEEIPVPNAQDLQGANVCIVEAAFNPHNSDMAKKPEFGGYVNLPWLQQNAAALMAVQGLKIVVTSANDDVSEFIQSTGIAPDRIAVIDKINNAAIEFPTRVAEFLRGSR